MGCCGNGAFVPTAFKVKGAGAEGESSFGTESPPHGGGRAGMGKSPLISWA